MRGWEAWRRERYNNQSANRVLAPEHAVLIPEYRRNQVFDLG